MRKFVEKVLFLENKQILKWGRFNAYMNLTFGSIALFSPLFIMTVIQEKAIQIAHTRRIEAGSLNGLNLFDSGDEFYTISYHLNRDASLIEMLPEMFSVFLFLIGIGLISAGASQLKLHKLLKEKEEQ